MLELEFDYSVWTPSTEIILCSVPWDNSYRDVVSFDSENEKRTYFASLQSSGYAIELEHLVYLKYGEPIRLAVPFSGCNRFNYIVVRNSRQPVPSNGGINSSDIFYYFINDIRYISPNCTELDIQLDVWTTYHNQVNFDMCYVERGHIGIANENATLATLNSYLIEPEGFEQGSYYEIQSTIFESFLKQPPWIVIICSADLTQEWGNVDKPKLNTAKGSINDGMPNGCACYALSGEDFSTLYNALRDAPWVSQCVQMLTVVPRPLIEVVEDEPVRVKGANLYPLQKNPNVSNNPQYEYSNAELNFKLPKRYENLLKFYTAPFSSIELTNFAGGSLTFSLNDIFGGSTLHINTVNVCNPPNIRAYVYPSQMHDAGLGGSVYVDYATVTGDTATTTIESGEFIGASLIYENFPQCAIANNNYLSYLASTANTRNYQMQSAAWSQQKALTGAQLAFNQSTASTNNMLENTRLSNNAAWNQTGISNEKITWGAIQGVANGIGQAGGAAVSRDVGGTISGATSAALAAVDANMNINWNNASTGIQTGLSYAQARNNAALANYNRDTNYDYAQFAAKGDYQNTIAAIQAKVQDAALTPPTLSGTTGGDAFNIANGFYGFALKFKLPARHFINQIGEFWLRYGYAINRFLTPPQNLKVMTKFSYWKMQNVMIRAQIPENHKNAIRGILESGVTIWNKPEEINAIDLAENKPLKGVAY